jgi:hypothetical protein
LLTVSTVQATNDYLEQPEHYTVMNVGNGVFRFYIPIWVYGFWNNYYLDSWNNRTNSEDTYIWYSRKPNAERGSDDVHRIATIAARRKGLNYENDVNGAGEGFIYMHAGNALIRNIKGGEALYILEGDDTYWVDWKNSLKLKRKNDDGHKDITYIEFDWYVPEELADSKDFYWGVSANIYNYDKEKSWYKKWWAMDEALNVSDPQTPELFTPYLYALDEDGTTGFGNAAIQYVTYQSPIEYWTSLDTTNKVPISENSGAIIVPTTDSVQRFFSATFYNNMSNDPEKLQPCTLKTNAIHIPAYHRIYDFRAEEILDDQQSITGQVKLHWAIRYPGAQDLVDGDMFQVERALKEDFSDAETVSVESFFSDSASYSFEDDPTAALMEATSANKTEIATHVSEKGVFTVYDEKEDIKIDYEAVLTSNSIYAPGMPVYYRVRRASSAVWGWAEGFSMTDTLTKNSFLAPLASTQADYTLDPDYENNRKVHFQIQIDNKTINLQPEPETECTYTYTAKQINGLIPIRLSVRGLDGINIADYRYKLYYMSPEGKFQQDYIPLKGNVFEAYVESGSMVQIGVIGKDGYSAYVLDLVGQLEDKAAFIADWELYSSGDGHNLYANLNPDYQAMESAKEQLIAAHPLPDSIRHALYTQLEKKVADLNQSGKRCNWDRNAMLYLQRISVETGDTIEFLVPADSIKRQEDGSWKAHMTNVADQACTHYKYAVRIDQSASVLKMMSANDLKAIAINGPEIYYNEVAKIARFDASQATDRYSVILTWEPTEGGVDYYELSRREAGSTADFELLTKTEDHDYRDNEVEPGKEYEYQIMASYTCNDSTSTHYATTTGSRSPYGMISGRIHYADGTGCPGVKVSLTSNDGNDGNDEMMVVTDGAGRYVFDSLLYGAGKDYRIVPTSTYAEFRFNNTSMTTASTRLDAAQPVAENIEFDNISAVRFSGRVLYSLSTIPVRDANLLLDGVMIETAGGPLRTDASGNFEILVPKNHQFTLQAVKEGHTFEGDGFVRMNNDSNLVLDKPLDGVRIWDKTKVRLAGRIVGGKIQAANPLGFGLSTNNLGDDLQLVLELEGDNISQIVRDPDDLTRDTLEYAVPHVVNVMSGGTDTVGTTHMHYQKKRIIINPDPKTGEYCADLFPIRYKVTQATAKGYATLFAEGKTSEVIDLSNAATHNTGEMQGDRVARWNEKYCITYRSPIDISCVQVRYGLVQPYMGEKSLSRQDVFNKMVEIPLAEKDSDNVYQYTFGAPVFNTGKYTFRIAAHEDYYYNNERTNKHEQVPINGGELKVYNGLHASEEMQTLSSLFPKWEQATQHLLGANTSLNESGEVEVTIPVDNVSFSKTGEQALRVLDVSVESDGFYVEKQAIKAYIMGNRSKGNDYMTKVGGNIELMDILRDPPGAKSYAYLESGTSFNYTYSWNLKLDFGAKFTWEYGSKKNIFFGSYYSVAWGVPGPVSGTPMSASLTNTIDLPLTTGFAWKNGGSYTFTTNERIETANDNWFVGSRGDIYIGVAQGVLLQMMDAVRPIDSISYSTMGARLTENVGNTGSYTTVAEGRSLKGEKYYLAIGEEMGASSTIDGTFAYSQDYILTVLIPQLLKERDALLVTGDSATVQAVADAVGHEVYWSFVIPSDTTFALENYKKIIPTGTEESMWIDVDRVSEYNETIAKWLDLLIKNEKEKITVMDGINADLVGNYTVSNGVKLSHSESYNATHTWGWKWTGGGGSLSVNYEKFFMSSAVQALKREVASALRSLIRNYRLHKGDGVTGQASPFRVDTSVPGAKTSFEFTPVVELDFDRDPVQSQSYTRSAGFVLEPDEYSYMNIDVFRRREEGNAYNDSTDYIRDVTEDGGDYSGNGYLYGPFVYRLNGGATKCPWEGPEESLFYERGGKPVQMSAGTMKLENPKIDILNHEVSDVPHDQPAIIKIRLANETEQTFENYVVFKLVLVDASNPNGLKVLMDGFPLTGDGRAIKLNPGQTIDKTLEVYAGEGYDFENITLMLASQCDILNFTKASFTVHYQPTSCDVKISTPHDKWVMNTLSPKDSVGWYLPVVIDGYDINYPNFDHIEFQYKLSKQSDDGWVNLCSYYADSTYFNEASGSKAMMKAGRIENIAFYGERDPMEQQYDLRAVSFCRYGSSYLTKSSPVLTGIKDTRPPRVFGEPEPANSILGVGDNLLLRYNEPIAGNYLDEDNNFQVTGITNTTGLSASTALHFDGNSSASTKAKRDLTETSFTIDMMIRPTTAKNRTNDMILFETGDGKMTKQLILTKDNRLRMVKTNGTNYLGKSSKQLEDIMAFTRVLCVYEKGGKTLFYIGTEDVTEKSFGATNETLEMQDRSAYFTFGSTYEGDMLEARVWTKALTLEEISATGNHSLTGYEQELLAYYKMNEGKGETVTDHAHGATLYLDGCSWNKQKGYSLLLNGEAVNLNGNLLGRSAIYDETMMFWFKAESNGTLFSTARQEATDSTAASGTLIALEKGNLVLYSGDQIFKSSNLQMTNGTWHHFVLAISRTYNNASLFVDGNMYMSVAASELEGITGSMYLGGNGFKGNIDEFVVFEQALPKSLIELYEDHALAGDEMGLMAYLPFEEQYTNPNGIIEQRFSVNDRRVFKDANGKVINKIVPLIIQPSLADLADAVNNAPVQSHGVLNKLYFDWSFNNDELMINILNRDYEVNKQPIYITVRDVEDLNGNPMASPVTWSAFVDRNSLKWSAKNYELRITNDESDPQEATVSIINQSGKRHSYTIESLPSWLKVDNTFGNMDPMGEKRVRLTFDNQIAVGEYSDIIYLTDENGLSEPLYIDYIVEALPPYDEIDEHKYPYNMSVCAQVKIGEAYDTDPNDIVYAFYNNECVGMEHVSFDNISNKSKVYLTVFGNDEMNRKPIRFQLWQASTGKLFELSTNKNVLFAHGFVYNCGDATPLILSTSGSETQAVVLSAGWNWISTNMDLAAVDYQLSACMTANDSWSEGDLIKNPNTREFSTYVPDSDAFIGSLNDLHFSQMYMVYAQNGNTMRIAGERLPEDSMRIKVRGDGQWSPLPCLFDETTPLTEALASYYQDASEGDLIKARNRFATFSEDKRWEGNLTALQPGEGYLFRRMALGSVEIAFYRQASKVASRKSKANSQEPIANSLFTNPNAATNMTIIAKIEGVKISTSRNLEVYVGDELAAVAEPITLSLQGESEEAYYFLTIQSDQTGELRFEIDGQQLGQTCNSQKLMYQADSHHGSLKAPIILKKADERPYKIIENDHVIIIRNGERYDMTGKKL